MAHLSVRTFSPDVWIGIGLLAASSYLALNLRTEIELGDVVCEKAAVIAYQENSLQKSYRVQFISENTMFTVTDERIYRQLEGSRLAEVCYQQTFKANFWGGKISQREPIGTQYVTSDRIE